MNETKSSDQKMKIREHIRERTNEWLKKATHELAYLRATPFEQDDPPTDTACKLAHWVAEYSLKAVLVFSKEKVRKHGHDLMSALAALIEIDHVFEVLEEKCALLFEYKVIFTYPIDPSLDVSVEEAQAAIEAAEEINAFITDWLKKAGL